MGFMDKAKKLAEQAQQKLDEAQESINKDAPQPGAQQPAGVHYDQHGRPIGEAPPAAAPPPPAAEPVAEAASETAPEAPLPSGDANSTPDPFKPLQQ